MSVFTLRKDKLALRVRSEKFGCLIFDGRTFCEGNVTAYFILKSLAQGKSHDEIAEELHSLFKISQDEISNDLNEFFEEAQKKGWSL